jgi:hypothetical protein
MMFLPLEAAVRKPHPPKAKRNKVNGRRAPKRVGRANFGVN